MQLDFLMLREIYEKKDSTQRSLSDAFFVSLGKVNQVMRELIDKDYIEVEATNNKNVVYKITKLGKNYLKEFKVDRAIILACGKGLRINPLTYDTHRSLLKVKNEVLIERIIKQLKEKRIDDIVVMVGYLKEQFEYLIDKYNVKLVYNKEYKNKNTLATLNLASDYIKNKNCYITVSDIYMEENLFHEYEAEPFYSGIFAADLKNEWQLLFNKKNKIIGIMEGGKDAYYMGGPAFFTKNFSEKFLILINEYYKLDSTDNFYWEDVLVRNFELLPDIFVHKVKENLIHEFDTIEDYKEFNKTLSGTGSKSFDFVEKYFGISIDLVSNIKCINEGITNKSYSFVYDDKKYVARIPGFNTDKYVDRKNEKEVYKLLDKKNISEKVLYIDDKGYKLSEFIENSRFPNPSKKEDLKRIVDLFKKFHSLKIKLKVKNDLFTMIDKHIDIMNKKNVPALYRDFDESLAEVKKIEKAMIKKKRPVVITHGDPNIGNVLLNKDGNVKLDRLIDFEYAGMADPLTDIALFCVYQDYSIEESLSFLKLYEGKLTESLKKVFVNLLALSAFYVAIWARVRDEEGDVDSGTLGIDSYHYFKKVIKFLGSSINLGK